VPLKAAVGVPEHAILKVLDFVVGTLAEYTGGIKLIAVTNSTNKGTNLENFIFYTPIYRRLCRHAYLNPEYASQV